MILPLNKFFWASPVAKRVLRLFLAASLVYLIVALWTWPTLQYKFIVSSLGDFAGRIFPEIHQGKIPYRDFFFEYPPLFTFSFYWMNLLSKLSGMAGLLEVSFFISVPIFFTIYLLLLPKDRWVSAWWLLLFLFIPALSSFDYMPAMIVTVALLLASHSKLTLSLTLLSVAVGWKIYPLVLLPFVILLGKTWRNRLFYLLFSTVLIIMPYVLFITWGGFKGLLDSYDFQMHRGVSWEAVPGIPYLVYFLMANPTGGTILQDESVYGRFNAPVVTVSSAAFLAVYFYLLKVAVKYAVTVDLLRKEIFNLSTLVLLLLIVFSKLLSPQYLLWYILLLPFTSERIYRGLYLLSLSVPILTIIQFIFYPVSPRGQGTPLLYVPPLLARNLILCFSLGVLFKLCLQSLTGSRLGGNKYVSGDGQV